MDSKHHWDTVYENHAADEVSWYQPTPEHSLEMIRQAGIRTDDPVLDVGGGASTLVDHLLAAGFGDITVLDLSEAAMEQARERLAERARLVRWMVADITRYRPERRFRLWHDRAAFHFLTDEADRRRYVAVLQASLEPGGRAIVATFAPDGPRRCSGLDVVRYDAGSIAKTLGKELELRDECRVNHRTPAGADQRFAYFLFERIRA